MDHLWAPWRMQFIKKCKKKNKPCIFCVKPKNKNIKKNHVLEITKHSAVLLNLYPYNNGHLMVSPLRHVTYLSELTREETCDLFDLLKKWEKVLMKVFKPHGFNMGANIGRPAGAGFEHLHFHIVPRWSGDANFMTVISDMRVLNMSLNELYELLIKHV